MNKKRKTAIAVIVILVSVCAAAAILTVRERGNISQKQDFPATTIKETESMNDTDNTDKEENMSETIENNDKKNHKKSGKRKVTEDDVIDVKNAFSSEKTQEEATQKKGAHEGNGVSQEEKAVKETDSKKQKDEKETEELWGGFY